VFGFQRQLLLQGGQDYLGGCFNAQFGGIDGQVVAQGVGDILAEVVPN
jgi:hypothetical protein